jgi:hypothetical protein
MAFDRDIEWAIAKGLAEVSICIDEGYLLQLLPLDVAAAALRVAGTEPREARQLPVTACFTLAQAAATAKAAAAAAAVTAAAAPQHHATHAGAGSVLNETAIGKGCAPAPPRQAFWFRLGTGWSCSRCYEGREGGRAVRSSSWGSPDQTRQFVASVLFCSSVHEDQMRVLREKSSHGSYNDIQPP